MADISNAGRDDQLAETAFEIYSYTCAAESAFESGRYEEGQKYFQNALEKIDAQQRHYNNIDQSEMQLREEELEKIQTYFEVVRFSIIQQLSK